MNCREESILFGIIFATTVISITITTILITWKEQIGYKRILRKYIDRYGDIVEYDPRTYP